MDRNVPEYESRRQSSRVIPGKVGREAVFASALSILLACTPAPDGADDDARSQAAASDAVVDAGAPESPTVRLGVDVLLRDSLALLRGRRVGLITNHTGLSWTPPAEGRGAPEDGVSTIDRLASHPEIELVALFSPEHGIRGRAEAGERVASERDPATGLPIHSLYGETRRPTPAMLRDVDALVFDIQDIGTRYYTYVWTMALAMEAAGGAGLPFVVLDRPNPIGGRLVQGNVLEPAFATFVGLYPVPMRHGLTTGELARMLVGEFGIDVDLHVVPMEGWRRDTWYDDTGLPFIPPSPNMPSLASATHYPGTCLFEGTNLSVGRGTARAFQQIGAPWLAADTVVDRLNALVRTPGAGTGDGPAGLVGVRFEAVEFTPDSPGDGKFGGEPVRGIRFVATDRQRYDPTRAAVAALVEIQRLHADRLEWRVAHFDRLAGTDALRRAIVEGVSLRGAVEGWAAQAARFDTARGPYLLYP